MFHNTMHWRCQKCLSRFNFSYFFATRDLALQHWVKCHPEENFIFNEAAKMIAVAPAATIALPNPPMVQPAYNPEVVFPVSRKGVLKQNAINFRVGEERRRLELEEAELQLRRQAAQALMNLHPVSSVHHNTPQNMVFCSTCNEEYQAFHLLWRGSGKKSKTSTQKYRACLRDGHPTEFI